MRLKIPRHHQTRLYEMHRMKRQNLALHAMEAENELQELELKVGSFMNSTVSQIILKLYSTQPCAENPFSKYCSSV